MNGSVGPTYHPSHDGQRRFEDFRRAELTGAVSTLGKQQIPPPLEARRGSREFQLRKAPSAHIFPSLSDSTSTELPTNLATVPTR